MALTESQKQEAKELFDKGYSTSEVWRHLGAQTIGAESSIEVQESAIKNVEQKPALKPISKKITGVLGLDSATQTFGDLISRSRLANVMQTPEQESIAELNAQVTGEPVQTQQEMNRAQIEAPTAKEIGGAVLQTAATAAAPAIAPVSLPAQIAAGAGLGYVYDVGADLQTESTLEQTLTPGGATIAGAVVPPALRGLGMVFRGPGRSSVELLGLPPGPVANVAEDAARVTSADQIGSTPAGNLVTQTASDVADRFKRAGSRVVSSVEERAARAERLANATPPVREGIKAELDDTLIDIVSEAEPSAKDAYRKMIELAESPRTGRATQLRPTDVAADTAVEQFDTILKQKRDIGRQIGELSDSLPTAQNVDVLAAQRQLRDALRQNGIIPDASGTLRFTNEALLPDQQKAIQTIYDKATKSEVFSAKQIHQMDQFFSATQRQSRLVDKIDDVYIKVQTPDGPVDVNIYKVFRDIFGQRLDEVAPEMRDLNRQYRQLSNLVDDVEGGIARDPNFASLSRDDRFASSGLRQMFGEGVKSRPLAELYEVMDAQSRQLGYEGPRADELYYVANKLRDIYPETIPETGFRANIGSSITDVVGNVFGAGKAGVDDQQRALKMLLDMGEEQAAKRSKSIPFGMSIQDVSDDIILENLMRLDPIDVDPIDTIRLGELQKAANRRPLTDDEILEAKAIIENQEGPLPRPE